MESSDFISTTAQPTFGHASTSASEPSLESVGSTPDARDEQASRFDLEKIFMWQDETAYYLKKGKFEEAFGVLDERNKLGEKTRNAPSILEHCVSLMATEGDYDQPKGQLKALIEGLNPMSRAVLWLAQDLCQRGRFNASLLMYEIYFELFSKAIESYVALEVIEKCVLGMKETASTMVENDSSLEPFVCRCVLPRLYDMHEAFARVDDANPQYKCVKNAWVVHGIEICESNRRKRMKIIEDTLTHMREVLGDGTVFKHQIFGTLSNNLGSTYLKQGCNDQAIEHFENALNCFNLATDFETDGKREKYARDTQRVLCRAKGLDDVPDNQPNGQGVVEPDVSELLKIAGLT